MSKMIQYKSCSKESKKPIYKRAWLGALAIVIVAGTTGCSDVDNSKEVNSGNVEAVQEVSQDNSENTIAENKLEDKVEDNVPMEYRPVMEKAQFYSNVINMSKARVYEELTAECGFTTEEAQYAVDNVKADWKENALKKAKYYEENTWMSAGDIYDELALDENGERFTEEETQYALDNLYNYKVESKVEENIPREYKIVLADAKFYSDVKHMSKARVHEKLTRQYEGMIAAEAIQYAVDNVKADWKENALESAKYYHQTYRNESLGEIYDQLTSEYGEQFTAEEAQYAIENLN